MKRAKKSFGKITVKKRVNVRAKEEEKKERDKLYQMWKCYCGH